MSPSEGRVLIDTSAWIEALRRDGDPQLRAKVLDLVTDGLAVLCDVVRLELWSGAAGTDETRMLRELERDLECVPSTEEVWRTSIEMARACRSRGVTVPAVDLLVAACAERHGLTLLHRDAHFDGIERAKREGGRS